MRKHHQTQIIQLLDQISKAKSNAQYADAQEAALFLCDFIDSVAGEGTKTVEMIEGFCELLFKAHNGEINDKLLSKNLVQIENSVKSELKPNKIEVAFVSYKAAQSDSIESIYLEAKKDPDCDAYWIPVPSYPVNSDKSLGEMEYEGLGFYDERFEITDYKEYDIEARRPDIIFTYYSYDKTSKFVYAHEDYHVKNLRKHTDMLVYVQYNVPENDVAWNNMTGKEIYDVLVEMSKGPRLIDGQLNLPGHQFSHHVIFHSENVKRWHEFVFNKNFEEAIKRKPNKHESATGRFLALGSPKIDKVIGYKRENFYMPEEWVKIIGNKKVFLYNISISGLGRNRNTLKQLGKILLAFEKSEDAVIWWRPHPHLEKYIAAELPELLDVYRKMVENFKMSGIGIFDETTDFHRSLAWSDAYYGDGSSLLKLYHFTGKPAMLSSIKVDVSDLSVKSDIDVHAVTDRLDFVRSFSDYAYTETDEFDLRDFITYVCSDANSEEKIKARKEMYINAYADSEMSAGERIYKHIKNEINK